MILKQIKESQNTKKHQDHNNLVGFFDLLLKIDKRKNPAKYGIKNKEKNND